MCFQQIHAQLVSVTCEHVVTLLTLLRHCAWQPTSVRLHLSLGMAVHSPPISGDVYVFRTNNPLLAQRMTTGDGFRTVLVHGRAIEAEVGAMLEAMCVAIDEMSKHALPDYDLEDMSMDEFDETMASARASWNSGMDAAAAESSIAAEAAHALLMEKYMAHQKAIEERPHKLAQMKADLNEKRRAKRASVKADYEKNQDREAITAVSAQQTYTGGRKVEIELLTCDMQ